MKNEVSVVAKVYDFLVWLLPHLAKFSRDHRFTLGDRLEVTGLELLESLVIASYRSDKLSCLHHALLSLERMRYLIRLSKDLRQLSLKQYEFAATALDAIGGEIGGWEKSVARRGNA